MKKVIALIGLVISAASVSHAQKLGKISFYECRPSFSQKMRLSLGADQKEMINTMIGKGQCSLATDLNFENVTPSFKDEYSYGDRLTSIDQLPEEYERSYCDGEDTACMRENEVNREGEADVTVLLLNPAQIKAITTIAEDGMAKKITNKSIYFNVEGTDKFRDTGNGYDGAWTYFDLKKSVLVIK